MVWHQSSYQPSQLCDSRQATTPESLKDLTMPTFFLISSSFVLAFTLVLVIENEIPLTKPRSLTVSLQQTFRLINSHPHALSTTMNYFLLLFNNHLTKWLQIWDSSYLYSSVQVLAMKIIVAFRILHTLHSCT